jgi:hypothetical protein
MARGALTVTPACRPTLTTADGRPEGLRYDRLITVRLKVDTTITFSDAEPRLAPFAKKPLEQACRFSERMARGALTVTPACRPTLTTAGRQA